MWDSLWREGFRVAVFRVFVSSCYTRIVLKNVTITISEETALWARKRAAEQNTSVSKLVGRLLEDQMRRSDEYWRGLAEWRELQPIAGVDASNRMSREETHRRG